MSAIAIKSRPVYGKLAFQVGTTHVFVADAEGARAILELAERERVSSFRTAQFFYVSGPTSHDECERRLLALGPFSFTTSPTIASILPKVSQALANARMGLRIYLTGTEGLIGQAMKVAMDQGIDHHSICSEHRGSLARRVQCVHCKGITEDVRVQPTTCVHCHLTLYVRDHYSRRIAAFQGVCIDAEEPGSAPEPQECFP